MPSPNPFHRRPASCSICSGIRGAIDRAGFIRSTGNTVWWGGDAARVEPFAGGALGWQVTANRLEPVLQQAAARCRRASRVWAVDDRRALARGAAFRSWIAPAALASSRAPEAGACSSPVTARSRSSAAGVRGRPLSCSDPTHTVIESYADGWAWSVPDQAPAPKPGPGYERMSPSWSIRARSDLAQDRTSRDVYVAEIQKTQFLARLVRDADLVSGPSGWDASMYAATRYADDRVLLVGDAGSFIDPLASIGVKKALASGWLAAVVTHTALTRPAMRRSPSILLGT